jgi:hypothetical protein
MKFSHSPRVKMSAMVALACLCGLLAVGCDERVQVTRDPDVRIAKGATWAWQPVTEPVAERESRKVTSRDTLARNERNPRAESVARDTTADNQLVRDRVRTAIQQSLTAKGLAQVSDPAAADFLVDYHFAVDLPMLGRLGLRAGGSWLRAHPLPRRHNRVRLHAAGKKALSLSGGWRKAGAERYLLVDAG